MRINERLIQLARQGLRVVRLKGGDPMVFGRGGEEALALAAAAVPFRVVPGISAGIGGLASAGHPAHPSATLGRSVVFATGHDASGAPAGRARTGRRWRGVGTCWSCTWRCATPAPSPTGSSRPAGTASEPLAFITDATTPRQQVRLATLGTAAAAAETAFRARRPR